MKVKLFRKSGVMVLVVLLLCELFFQTEIVAAVGSRLSETRLNDFAQNDVLFYNPDGGCIDSGGGTICGDTAREKYWSALGKYFDDPIKKAGIMGNMWEEGQFSPTSWQCYNVMSPNGEFLVPWDTLYNNSYGLGEYGVGSVGITYDLSKYLHWLNDNHSDLLKYLQDPPTYAYNYCRHSAEYGDNDKKTPGDEALSVLGAADFDKLVDAEVTYMIEYFEAEQSAVEGYKNQTFSTPSEAARWWYDNYEKGTTYNARAENAEKAYADFKDFNCAATSSRSSNASSGGGGDYSSVKSAKNANESVFNVESGSKWSASWGDGDVESMTKLLDNYGDLAYQLGRVVNAPWVAILVQMRYEDPNSVCGKNNFWGNGCDSSHAYAGGSTIQGENLGEGFSQYGETLTNGFYDSALGIEDPKEYLETIGPMWVQGDPNGAGYGSIESMKNSVDALQEFIESPEGQTIVKQFGSYNGSICGGSTGGNGDINATALELAWPERGHDPWNDVKPEYKTALAETGVNQLGDSCSMNGNSCDAYVTAVMRYSGADPDFYCCGVTSQYNYITSSDKYMEVNNSLDSLQPGDIRISPGQHIEMYVEVNGEPHIASASHCDRTAEVGNYYDNDYYVFRFKK